MNELSLFTGIGGGLLGTHGLLGWRCRGYVEFNPYCQRVIRQRIADGILDEAPIFGDIRTFVSDGFARSYRGMVDVVSAGFPCQPYSIAGKRAAASDERDMWPSTLDVIREVRPQYCNLENVTGLLSIDDGRYFGRILQDLASCGYDARWRVLSAAEVGAPHKRDRLWIVAHTNSLGHRRGVHKERGVSKRFMVKGEQKGSPFWNKIEGCHIQGLRNNEATSQYLRSNYDEPDWVDRIKAIGNGQVPAVAAAAWNLLTEDLNV